MPTRNKRPSTSKFSSNNTALSNDAKTIIVVLLLLLAYPIGTVLMWMWMKQWPIWLKSVITIPFAFGIFAAFFMVFIMLSIIRRSSFEVRERHNMYYNIMPPGNIKIATPAAGNTY